MKYVLLKRLAIQYKVEYGIPALFDSKEKALEALPEGFEWVDYKAETPETYFVKDSEGNVTQYLALPLPPEVSNK